MGFMEVASRTTAENTLNCHCGGASRKPPPPTELQDPGTVTTLIVNIVIAARATRARNVLCTAQYCSPESCAVNDIDFR